jgi:hypothetical protein
MKNLFIINEEEKNRILNLHETATKRQYLSEQSLDLGQQTQPVTTVPTLEDSGSIIKKGLGGDPYIYAKLGNDYYYAKGSDGDYPNWVIASTPKAINSIKGKIYNEKIPIVKTVKSPVKQTAKKQPVKSTTSKTTSSSNFKPKLNPTSVDRTSVGKGNRLGKVSTPTIKTPENEKSIFGSIANGVKQFWTNAKSFVVPIHYRIFYDFLSLRRDAFTVTDMSNEEQQALKQMIQYGYKKGFKNGGNMNFYDIANKLNTGGERIDFKNKENLGLSQMNLKNEYTKIAMTLGNAKVTKNGNVYDVTDTYDFNNYQNNPEKYTLKEVPSTVKDSIKKMASGNLVQGVEQMASYYQKLGYKGIPVNIELPA